MSVQLPSLRSRHGLFLNVLKGSLAVGAVYDAVLAALLAFFPQFFADLLNVPLPGEAFYLHTLAVVVGMLSMFYLLAAYDPVAYHGNVAVAILGRSLAALVLGAAAWRHAHLGGLWLPALGDGLFAVVHAVSWWATRKWR